jgi:FtsP/CotA-like multicopper oxidase with cupredoxin domain
MPAFDRVLAACRVAVFALVLGATTLVHAQGTLPALPDADKQQIKKYTLSEDAFGRLAAATREARAAGIPPQAAPDASKVHSLDDLANQAMAADPRIPALVKKYGFTPREFMLANIALMNAVMAVQARNDPALSGNLNQVWVNADNIRFVESHQADVQALLQGR